MRALVLCALAACTPAWKRTPHDQLFQIDAPTKVMARPIELDPSDWWDKGDLLLIRPLGRLLSPGTYVEALARAAPPRATSTGSGRSRTRRGSRTASAGTTSRRSRRATVPPTIASSPPAHSP